MKIAFSRESILALDPDEFSDSEKRELLEKFFPAVPLPDWKRKLRKEWSDSRRWRAYSGIEDYGDAGAPYRFTNDYLRHMAKLRLPVSKGNRVTDFTRWIYSLYRGRPDAQALQTGKAVERQVAAHLGSVPESTDWQLIYEDPLDQLPEAKRISSLVVGGKPLWGAPDLVFRNRSTGAITIVERKASNRDIPRDGWPNLRAQLWAYAHIDDWVEVETINLVGEVWGFSGSRVFLRKVLRWNIDDDAFYDPNANLFEAYQSADCSVAGRLERLCHI